jgi:hypothetical protein
MNINRYKKISTLGQEFKPISIKTFIPTPNEMDYKRGYLVRYFCQKSNDKQSTIYEIDTRTYSKLLNTSFYITASLDWRIIGTDAEIRESNSKSIKIACKKIPSLFLYLPNLIQFHNTFK